MPDVFNPAQQGVTVFRRSTSRVSIAPLSRILVLIVLFVSPFASQSSTLRAAPWQQGGLPDQSVSMYAFGPLVQGQRSTYSIGWGNYNAEASNVVLTNTLPAGMSLDSAYPTPSAVSGNVITWTLGNLWPYSAGSINLTVLVTAAPGTALTNIAAITSTSGDANPANNAASVSSLVVLPVVDMSVYKSYRLYRAITPGSIVEYSLSYSNYSTTNTPAQNVVLTDTLPAGMEFITTTRLISFTQTGNQLVWNLGTVMPNNITDLWVSMRVPLNTPIGTFITNTAAISSTTLETNLSNNTAELAGTVVTATRDVQVIKQVLSSSTILPGQLVTYGLSIGNRGNANASNVVLIDTLPAGVTFVSASGPISPSLQGNQVTWNIGDLQDGFFNYWPTYIVTVQVPVNTPFGTVITNTATASLAETDVSPSNNTALVSSVVVSPSVGLFINKTSNTISASRGEWVTYTLQYGYGNNFMIYGPEGNSDATHVVITDTLPAGMSYVHSSSPVPPILSGNKIIWPLGTIPRPSYYNASAASFILILRVNDDAFGGLAINVATIGSDVYEVTPSDNTSAAAFNINAPALTRGVTVTAPLRYTAVAGDSLLVAFTMINTGVMTDTFNLNFAQTKGWANFVGLPAAVTLIAGASTTLQVPVSAPAGGVVGDLNQISLTAQSAGDSSKTAIGSTQVVINRSRVFLPITLRQ